MSRVSVVAMLRRLILLRIMFNLIHKEKEQVLWDRETVSKITTTIIRLGTRWDR